MVFTHDLILVRYWQYRKRNTKRHSGKNSRCFPDKLSKIVLAALKQFQTELETGALVTVNEAQAKARILPIKRNS